MRKALFIKTDYIFRIIFTGGEKMFKVSDIVEVEITGLGSTGEGVGKADGFTIFVHGALTGEKVKARLTIVKKNYANGRLMQVLHKSEFRQKPICEEFYQCGGCQLQHLTYPGQLLSKQQQVKDALGRIGHFKDIVVLPVIGAPSPLAYRNKMQCPIASQDGTKIGFYKTGTHEVVDLKKCYIQTDTNNLVIEIIREWIRKYKISIYNEKTGKGLLRHIIGRVSADNNAVMVGLVCTQKSLPNKDELVEMLKEGIPNLTSVIQNINSRNTNVIMGEHTRVIWGSPTITDKIGNFSFDISANSFFQVNTKQASALYATALEFAELTGKENVADLYCGIGTISLFLASKAKQVWGIEIVNAANENAKDNAMKNQITNTEFICQDVAIGLEKLSKKKKLDVIVLDPPRAGCDKLVLERIISANPARIVYVSCNPASLARDLKILVDSGQYQLVKVQPVDMFAQTAHIESVSQLIRK